MALSCNMLSLSAQVFLCAALWLLSCSCAHAMEQENSERATGSSSQASSNEQIDHIFQRLESYAENGDLIGSDDDNALSSDQISMTTENSGRESKQKDDCDCINLDTLKIDLTINYEDENEEHYRYQFSLQHSQEGERTIDKIYQRPEFNGIYTEPNFDAKISWEDIFGKKDPDEEKEAQEQASGFLLKLFEAFRSIGTLAEIVLWIIVITLVLFLVLGLRRWLTRVDYSQKVSEWEGSASQGPTLHTSLKEESFHSLLHDIETLLSQGRIREACAKLYRASLYELMQCGVRIEKDATELELLQFVQSRMRSQSRAGVSNLKNETGVEGLTTPRLSHFKQVTRMWRGLAYANMLPIAQNVLQLASQHQALWSNVGQLTADVKNQSADDAQMDA